MNAQQQLTHVFPSWAAGSRKFHPKFGGPVINGIEPVADRLMMIKEKFPDDRSSGHNLLEVRVDGYRERLNSPNAISWKYLQEGIQIGSFPLWSAMTHPAFGLPGVELGSILSEDEEVRNNAYLGHLTAIQRSRRLKRDELGLGYTIWWPATDSGLHRGPLSRIDRAVARQRLIDWWVNILQNRLQDQKITESLGNDEPLIWLEYKPSVPGCFRNTHFALRLTPHLALNHLGHNVLGYCN